MHFRLTSRGRRLAAGLLPVVIVLTGCSSSSEPASATAPAEGRTVITSLGEVTVPTTIDSVVVLEGRRDLDIALALGLPLKGFPFEGPETGVELPLPIGDELALAREAGAEQLFLADEIDVEAIAQAQPDLIIGRISDIEPIVDELTQIAPVLPVGTHDDGVSWQDDLRLVAQATDTEARADEVIAAFDERVAQVRSAHSAAIAATPVAPIGYDMEGTEVEGTRLQSVLLQELQAVPSVAFGEAIKTGAVEFGPEQTLEAWRDAGALLVMADTQEEWDAAQKDPLFTQLPAVQAGAMVRSDKMTHEGGPITATHVLDLIDEMYGTIG
ncbi:ABC transporter substrate-binding protein [soil metagenome]